jgi:hypothetical protein
MMSRVIDMDNLDEDDKLYLAQRGQLPTDVASVEEQRQMLDPEAQALALEDRANTGDVNLANVSKEYLEAELARRREAEAEVDTLALMSKEGLEGAEDNGTEDYSGWTKSQLLAEIADRNEKRDSDQELSLVGNKADLIAALEADDAGE